MLIGRFLGRFKCEQETTKGCCIVLRRCACLQNVSYQTRGLRQREQSPEVLNGVPTQCFKASEKDNYNSELQISFIAIT